MTFAWEQRDRLLTATAELVVQWLALLDDRSKINLINYLLVHDYSGPELKRLNEQATARIAAHIAAKHGRAHAATSSA